MTVKEYIGIKLESLHLTDAHYLDFAINTGLCLDDDYCAENQVDVNKGMIGILEDVILSPRINNVSEGGFSISYDYSEIGKLYMWLCRKYDIEPNYDMAAMLGISMIIDRTHDW